MGASARVVTSSLRIVHPSSQSLVTIRNLDMTRHHLSSFSGCHLALQVEVPCRGVAAPLVGRALVQETLGPSCWVAFSIHTKEDSSAAPCLPFIGCSSATRTAAVEFLRERYMPFLLLRSCRLFATLCLLASVATSTSPTSSTTPPSASARSAASIANGGSSTPPIATPNLPNVVTFNSEAAQVP